MTCGSGLGQRTIWTVEPLVSGIPPGDSARASGLTQFGGGFYESGNWPPAAKTGIVYLMRTGDEYCS